MIVTEIRFSGEACDGFRSYVTVVFDGVLAIHRMKILRRKSDPSRLMLCMPNRKRNDGTFEDFAHPVNKGFREDLERRVIDHWNEHTKRIANYGDPTGTR